MPQPSRCSPSASLRYRNAVTWPESDVGVTVSVQLGQAGDAQLLGGRASGTRRTWRTARRPPPRPPGRRRCCAAGRSARGSSSGCASRGRASRSPSRRRSRRASAPSAVRCSTSPLAGGQASARRHLPEESSTSTGGPSGAVGVALQLVVEPGEHPVGPVPAAVRALGVRVLVVPLAEQLVHADAVLLQRDRPRDRVRGPDVPVGHPLDEQHAAAVVAARRAGAGCARPSSRPRRARRCRRSRAGRGLALVEVRAGRGGVDGALRVAPRGDRVVQDRPVVVVVARDEQPEARVERPGGEGRGRTGR